MAVRGRRNPSACNDLGRLFEWLVCCKDRLSLNKAELMSLNKSPLMSLNKSKLLRQEYIPRC